LATLASLLIVVFDANLTRLIQLYLVGVFVAFTLSQTGMVVHWRRMQERNWKKSAVINGVGAFMTAVVLAIVVATKLIHGAWLVVVAIPLVIWWMRSVSQHYQDVALQIAHPWRRPPPTRAAQHHLVILVNGANEATARAVGYAKSILATSISAVTFEPANQSSFQALAQDVPCDVLHSGESKANALRHYLRAKRAHLEPVDFLTLVVPEILESRSLVEIFKNPSIHTLKATLLREPGVQVLDIPVLKRDAPAEVQEPQQPARNYAVVLAAGVHNPTKEAVRYAETLDPTDLRVVNFGLSRDATERLIEQWLDAGIPYPLEIEGSPFRDIGASLKHYVRQFEPDGINQVVTVVLPEFVVKKRRHNMLHGQTALVVKRALLFEPGVVVASVPYHLGR
jgi:hypothetical protein